ncbi:MAG: iron export ABC transporter permease subunit FetB [Kiloniellales bacterium]
MSPVWISEWELALAALLLIANAGLSLALGLGIGGQMLFNGLRMVVQLWLIGLVLTILFQNAAPHWTLLMMLVMCLFAAWEVRARQTRRLAGWWGYGLGAGTIVMAGTLITLFALTVTLELQAWYDPRYAIPLLGMILGNTMTGTAIGLNTFTDTLWRDRDAAEARLALGGTRWQAVSGASKGAVKNGLIPTINAMAAAGVVSLPGMMTGQILAGVDPMLAIRYQILVMFLIAGGTGLGVLAAVFAAAGRLTDRRHRLRLDRLAVPPAAEV